MAETSVSFDLDSLVGESPATAEDTDETTLVEELQLGAEEAYEMLIARYRQPIYNLVFRLVEDPGDTSDIVQEIFVKVFRYIGSFRMQSSLKTWIYRIAVNEARNYRRWFCRHTKREVGLESEEGSSGRKVADILPDPGRSPYDITLGSERRTLIEQELVRLKPVFRQAVVLRDVEELSYEQIAEILEVSIGTVKSRILRGREALRRNLSDRMKRSPVFEWAPQPAEQD